MAEMTDNLAEVMTVIRRVEALDQHAREVLLFMLVGRMSVENIRGLKIDIEGAENVESVE